MATNVLVFPNPTDYKRVYAHLKDTIAFDYILQGQESKYPAYRDGTLAPCFLYCEHAYDEAALKTYLDAGLLTGIIQAVRITSNDNDTQVLGTMPTEPKDKPILRSF